jgi:hypothetical protein
VYVPRWPCFSRSLCPRGRSGVCRWAWGPPRPCACCASPRPATHTTHTMRSHACETHAPRVWHLCACSLTMKVLRTSAMAHCLSWSADSISTGHCTVGSRSSTRLGPSVYQGTQGPTIDCAACAVCGYGAPAGGSPPKSSWRPSGANAVARSFSTWEYTKADRQTNSKLNPPHARLRLNARNTLKQVRLHAPGTDSLGWEPSPRC